MTKPHTSLALEIWSTAARHFSSADALPRITALLAQKLPVRCVMIRKISEHSSKVETAAVSGNYPLPQSAPAPRPEDISLLLNWCRQDQPLKIGAADAYHQFPTLLPANLSGTILAAPLTSDNRTSGVLILIDSGSRINELARADILDGLIEPFTLALINDQQIRELQSRREAVEADNRSLLSRLGRQDISDTVVGAETGLSSVVERINLLGNSDVPVLLLGETGSGKEVVARAVHTHSQRTDGPFLRVNCGAIPPELLDSQLFGHERGSFTGAVGERKGWFERAHGGTLFLDEIGELTPAAQVRFLRILQDGSFEKVGGQRQLNADVRIIAATHRDLKKMVAEGTFREDLWYRIAVFPIFIPPLRERLDDIPALSTHFALRAAKRLGNPPLAPDPEDFSLLAAYDWPGNIRELSAVMERAAILGGGRRLEVAKALGLSDQLHRSDGNRQAPNRSNQAPGSMLSLDQSIAHHIGEALSKTRGRIEGPDGAAKLLGINPQTLRGRMRKLKLDWRRFRHPA